MKTTDRVLSFLLALVMVFSLFSPGLAYAEEPEEEGTIAPVEDPAPVPDDPAAPVGDGVLDVPTDDSDSTGSIAPAAETETVELASGSCGTNLTWRLTDDGVLTISGTGAMTTYSSSNAAPWNSYKNSITSLVVESGVTTIGAYAFYGCNQLVSATLPDSVTTLSSAAFRNCTKLTNVNLPSNLGNWGLGDNVFNGCSSLAQIIIPSNVKYIQSYAFLNCSALTSVSIPEGVTSIGSSAFKGCSSLTELTLPGSVNTISTSAFADCSALTEIVIPDGVEELQSTAFQNCASLARVSFGSSTKYIRGSAFKGCTSLVELRFPVSISSLGASAFEGCTGLKRIYFLGNPPTIYDTAFTGVSARANYPYFNENWTEDKLQNYGGSLTWGTWDPYYVEYDLTIAGEKVTAGSQPDTNHLSNLIDNTFAWTYDPDTNTLHLQGYWDVPADYAYNYVIWNSIPGLTISVDSSVSLHLAAGTASFTFLRLSADTTITGNGNYSLSFVGPNNGSADGVYVGGHTLTLRDLKLYAYNNIRYAMDGGTSWQSALNLESCSGILTTTEAAIFRFPQGIDMDDCCFVQPFGAVIDSQGIVCESNGSTWAAYVVLGRGPYPLGVAGVTVTESNKEDILDNGIFSFNSDTKTLYINGNWQSTANAPVIENYINGLTVVVASEYGALSSTSSSQSIRGLIESHGSMTIRPLETDAGYSLTLAGSGVFNRAGIHMYGDSTLTVQDMDLTISNTGYGLRGDEEGGSSALRLERSRVSCEGIFTSGFFSFKGGVTLTGCGWAVPAYPKLSGGSLCIESWDGDQLVKDLLVHPTVYDLVIDGTRVYADNASDILGNGVFAYNVETNTLSIYGDYSQPTATAELLKTYKVRPVIDSGLNELRIELGGDVTLTAALENYNSYTPIINSTGSRFFLRAAEGTETMPVLTLAGAGSIAFDGIHSKSLTVKDIDLRVSQGARKGLLGENGSELTFINCCGDIWGYANDTGAAVTGYTGGISLDHCGLIKGVASGGTIFDGEIAGRVRISNALFDLYVDGIRLSAGNTSVLEGRAVYDPETNTLILDGLGEPAYKSANLPYIENHIPGLTILVASGIELGTTSSANIHGLIESDQDLTITAPGDTGRLVLDGIGSITNGVKMLNGADLTLQGVRVLVQNVENGLMGTAGSALTVSGSWVEIHAGTAAVNSFTQGITLEQDKITDPEEAYVDGARIYDPAISAPAKTVTITPPEHFHDEIDFLPWTGATRLPSVPGSYYLCNDVTLSETWTVPEGRVDLCLNGHTIHMAESQRVIKIPDNATLNLYDCRETPGEITGGYDSDGGGGVRVELFGTLNLYGGKITHNASGGNGGGVVSWGFFHMYGGEISNNSAENGGGVYIGNNFTMSGGKISNNKADYGGGVYDNGTFTMTGGEISSNLSALMYGGFAPGGGVYVAAASKFTMTGGKIRNNRASAGGGVYIDSSSSTIRLSGAPVIEGNQYSGDSSLSDLYLANEYMPLWRITVSGALTEGARIGVRMQSPTVFTSGYDTYNAGKSPAAFFFSDNSSYYVGLGSGEALLTQETFTVSFSTTHGTTPAAQTVGAGGAATRPADPSEEGWIFAGWFQMVGYSMQEYDFSAPVTADLVLFAMWKHTVSFDVQGHGTAPESQTVNDGETATEPTAPTAEGWTFGGWYTDAACTAEYDFATPVTVNLTLYAKWTETVETYGLWLGEIQVTERNKADILGDGTASYDPETKTLTFTVAEPAIRGLFEESLLGTKYRAEIWCLHELNIQTSGELRLTNQSTYGNVMNWVSYMIRVNGPLSVNGDLTIDCDATYGVSCSALTVNGSVSIDIKHNSDGDGALVSCVGDVHIAGDFTGSTRTSRGLYFTNGTLRVDGNVTIRNSHASGWGIYGGVDATEIPGTVIVGPGAWDVEAYVAIRAKTAIVIPETHRITTPAGGLVKEYGGIFTITVPDGSSMASHVIIVPAGDINRDGEVNALDLMLLRKYLVDLPIEGVFDEAAADLNGDNVIDILDLVRLRKMLA